MCPLLVAFREQLIMADLVLALYWWDVLKEKIHQSSVAMDTPPAAETLTEVSVSL